MLESMIVLAYQAADKAADKGAGVGDKVPDADKVIGAPFNLWWSQFTPLIVVGLVLAVAWAVPLLIRRWRAYASSNAVSSLPSSSADKGEGFSRDSIAWTVIAVGGLVVLMLSIRAVTDKAEGVSDRVLASVLPLVGTWVGTVMAYYFGERSLRAAAETVRSAQSRDDRMPVKEAMIHAGTIKSLQMESDPQGKDNPESIKLADVVKQMKDNKVFRVPVMRKDSSGAVVVHSDPLNQFLLAQADAGKDAATRAALTLKDLFADEVIGPRIAGKIAYVAESDTIGKAKGAMQGVPGCQDVFVTKRGGPRDEIVGWLTNNEIQRYAE